MMARQTRQGSGFSRRDFMKTVGITAGLGITSGPVARSDAAPVGGLPPAPLPGGKYNVLFILSDQERYLPELLGKGHWPGRDRLARMGTTFTNHQICTAVCTPSRSVIFTGQHVQHTKMFDNTDFPWIDNMSFEIPTIGHMMRDAGYYSAYQGKWHLHQQIHEHFPPGGPLQLVGHDIMDRYGFSDFTGIGDVVGMTLGGYETDEFTTAVTQSWLRRKGAALNREGQPWFLTLSLVNPHDVMFYNTDAPGEKVQGAQEPMLGELNHEPDDKIYKHKWNLPLAASRQQPWDKPGRPQAHREYQNCRKFLVGFYPNEDARWQRLQDYYLNCISDNDRSVDRILTELDNLGMLSNTIVIFTSDHGELCGAHGMAGKGATAYREQNNVPFIVYHPAMQGGRKCKAVTSHADIVPTILGLTGADKEVSPDVQRNLHGHDMAPLLKDPEDAPHDALRDGALYCYSMWSYMDADWLGKIVQALGSGEKVTPETAPRPDVRKRSAIRSIFDGRYKFNRYFNMSQHNRPRTLEQLFETNDVELYDTQNDPHEMHNLALDRETHGDLLLAMNKKLDDLIVEEVGRDVGQHLPDLDGVNWAFDHFDV